MQQMAQIQIEEEIDPGLLCEVYEDSRCKNEATRIVRESFTPAAFKVRCCDEHAEDLISQGYKPVNGITCNECGERLDPEQDERGTCLDCQAEIDRKERARQELEDRAEERSQYRHLSNSELVELAVRESNERMVILPNGDWYWREQ